MDKIKRKETIPVKVGDVTIGGGAPVVIQSMTNTNITDLAATSEQVNRLSAAGCELVRLAVPDQEAAQAFAKLAEKSPVPLIADIHFDVRLAYLVMEYGAAKVRINPGNIGGKEKLKKLSLHAEKLKVPIRIGVNAGSLEKKLLAKHGGVTAAALVESALGYLETLEETGFARVVVSLKASDVYTTICAYRLFSEKKSYPVHLGVTGAGPLQPGMIKGAIGIGALLSEGIGDTIRVSLTANPVEEVRVARQIIQALGLKKFFPELISCPTCGRCSVDLVGLVGEVEKILQNYNLPLKVAVMGCAVNGPGEAKEADLGISAGKKHGIVFSHGRVTRTVGLGNLLDALKEELESLALQSDRKQEG